MIYFMQSTDGGPVKIGYSDNVETRHKQLEAHYGRPLALLATLPGGRDEEQAIHDRFADLRFGRTEQFRPEADLMAFIGRPLLVGANPDAVEAMGTGGTVRTIGIRVSVAYAEWLTKAAKHDRVTIAAFLDRAAADRAREIGFNDAPPERIA